MYEAPKKSKINFSSIEKIADATTGGGGSVNAPDIIIPGDDPKPSSIIE